MLIRLLPLALPVLLLGACGDGESSPPAEKELELGAETGGARTARDRPPAPARPAMRPPPPRARGPRRPAIESRPIPFGPERLEQTAAYSARHYGERKTRLDPRVIVQHFTVLDSAEEVIARFSSNRPDAELHELPGVCSHYLIDRDGTILQLVSERRICRHTVGLNDVAIGIEHVGASDAEVLENSAQLAASLRLTAWLQCRYGVATGDVIGHAESLTSPHHHEGVPSLRRQTHDDFKPPAMRRYRARLTGRDC